MGGGRCGLYTGTHGSEAVPGSIDYMSRKDLFSLNIRKRKDVDADGFFDVIAHGSAKSIFVEHNGQQVMIDHRALARLLKNDRRSSGKAIRLLSCCTGVLPRGFAQGLADKLGVEVKAPDDYLWSDQNGNYFVTAGKWVNGRLQPEYSKPGNFVVFIPRGGKKK